MFSGGTLRAAATVGTAVFRIVVSRDSIKKAVPTSQSRRTLFRVVGEDSAEGAGWSTWLANMTGVRAHAAANTVGAPTAPSIDTCICGFRLLTRPFLLVPHHHS